jgi:hypothetical protein
MKEGFPIPVAARVERGGIGVHFAAPSVGGYSSIVNGD